jgi:hypothetical protein
MNAPSYKISKHLANIFNKYLNLNHHYNVKNSTSLAEDLTKLKIDENCKMLIYDIKDLYVKIPTKETQDHKVITPKKRRYSSSNQIITLLENILQQNYFAFQNKLYQPEKVIKGI